MSVSILIVSHDQIGRTLLDTAIKMIGVCPLDTEAMAVSFDADVDQLKADAIKKIQQLNSGDGVLVLTDVYGSTPSNIASSLSGIDNVRVVAGVNLPMLIRILNYPRLNLSELAIKALSGGRDGVLICSPEQGHITNGTAANKNN